jgi:spore germination protein KC
MSKKIALLFLTLLLPLTLCGCWDQQELESLALVQALGLELNPDHKSITVTTIIPIPSKLGVGGGEGGGGGEEGGVIVTSTQAPSIYEAFNLINTSINREITLCQNQILVFGETMAKAGVHKWIDNLVRFREMRRTLLLFICQGKIEDVFKVRPELEQNPAEYLSDLVNLSSRTAMYPRMMFNEFMGPYEAYAQANFAPLITLVKPPPKPPAGSGQNKAGTAPGEAKPPEPTAVRLIGTAVFRADRVVGKLDLYETQILRILTNHFNETFITVDDPMKKGHSIALRLLKSGPVTQIKYRKIAGQDTFTVKINLEAELLSIQSEINYTEPKLETVLAGNIARKLKRRIDRVIAKTQHQFKADIFGFGVKIRNSMLTTKDWEAYHWPAKFPEAQINTEVKIAIRRVGVQFRPPLNHP